MIVLRDLYIFFLAKSNCIFLYEFERVSLLLWGFFFLMKCGLCLLLNLNYLIALLVGFLRNTMERWRYDLLYICQQCFLLIFNVICNKCSRKFLWNVIIAVYYAERTLEINEIACHVFFYWLICRVTQNIKILLNMQAPGLKINRTRMDR